MFVAEVTIYTVPNCMDCAAVKHLLSQENVTYREIDISEIPQSREALAMLSGMQTVPQVFVGRRFIGQVANIRYLIQTGKLASVLNDDPDS